MAKPHFLGKTGGQASFFWEKTWQSIATWGKQVAEPSFSSKTGGRALFFEKKGGRALLLGENSWPTLISQRKLVVERFLGRTDFLGKTGGRA